MNTWDHDESQNPYRATVIDEKPVDAAEFFRAEPQYRKLVPGSVSRTNYAAFMLHKWRFIGLGVAQGLFLIFPIVAVVWLLVQHPDMAREQPWLPWVALAILALLAVFMIVVSIGVSLRILRKERMVFLSTPRDAARLAWCMLHTLIYMGVYVLLLATIYYATVLGVGFLADGYMNWSDKKLIFVVVFGIAVFVAWIALVTYTAMRTTGGIHLIVDRGMNCLSAARTAWRYTRGNARAMINDKKVVKLNLIMLAAVYLTGGLGLVIFFGYASCWSAVAYLMLTGQCELLEQRPDEW